MLYDNNTAILIIALYINYIIILGINISHALDTNISYILYYIN